MNSQTAWYFYYLCQKVTEEFPVGAVSPSIRPLSTSEAPADGAMINFATINTEQVLWKQWGMKGQTSR